MRTQDSSCRSRRERAQTLLSQKSLHATTLLEILVVLAVLGVLVTMLLPAVIKMKQHDRRVNCVNNLKQIGMAFRVWEGNGGRYPMSVPQTNGGSMEFTTGPNAWRHFQVLSNHLVETKWLVCPADGSRSASADFASLRNANLSYFIGVNVTNETDLNMILSGDRNITNSTPITNGMLTLTTNTSSGWTSEMHARSGILVLGDCSVQAVATTGLRTAIAYATNAPTILQMPVLAP